MVHDSEGRSRGFGFVRFIDLKERERAMVEMNHHVGLGTKAISISSATPRR